MLKKFSSIPLYDQLINAIVQEIKTKLNIGDKLLSEREIGQRYGVSRTTVRQALSELEELGYIYKKQGKGTFVSGLWKEMKDLSSSYSFTEQMEQLGKKPLTEILSFKIVIANMEVVSGLQISSGESVYELKRLRSADNMPLMHEISYIPVSLFPALTMDTLLKMPLYDVFTNIYNFQIKYADEEFSASLMDKKEANLLDRDMNDACLRMKRTTYRIDNEIIEYTISVARSDQFVYKIRHSRK